MLVFKIKGVGKFKKQECHNPEGLIIFNGIILSLLPKPGIFYPRRTLDIISFNELFYR